MTTSLPGRRTRTGAGTAQDQPGPLAAPLAGRSGGDAAVTYRGTAEPVPLSRAVLGLVFLASVVMVGGAAALGPLAGAAAILLVIVGLLLLRRPELAGLLVVSVTPALSGLQRGFPVPGARISELLVAGAAGIVLTVARRSEPRWRAVDWALLAYAATTLALGLYGAARNHVPLTGEVWGTLVGPFQFLLIYRTALTALPSAAARARALRAVMWAALPVVGVALFQRFGGTTADRLLARAMDTSAYTFNDKYFTARAGAPFPHWHFLAGYLLLVALLAVALLVDGRFEVLGRRATLVVLLACVAGILLTLTIVAIGGLALGVVLIAIWSGRAAKVLTYAAAIGLVGAIGFAPLLASRVDDQYSGGQLSSSGGILPETVSYRVHVWTTEYGPALSGRLLNGYGPTIPPEVGWKYTESLYITLLLRGGLPLLLVYAALMAALFACAQQHVDDLDVTRRVPARVLAAVVVTLVPMHAVFPYFVGLGLPHLLWGLTGLLLSGLPARSHALKRRRAARAAVG